MSAYESMVSEHWGANLPNLPDAARGYFACFALIRNAWDSCVNGAWLLRLALELATDEPAREDVRRVAADVLREMGAQLDRHFAERTAKDDPIRFAYEDAKTEIRIAVEPTDRAFTETAVSEPHRPTYERSIRVLRRFSADLVRARLSAPIGLRPDPAFEDTKAIPPTLLPELARMKAEIEAAAAAQSLPATTPSPGVVNAASSSAATPPPPPGTVPSTQPTAGGIPRPAPRPSNPGTGGSRPR